MTRRKSGAPDDPPKVIEPDASQAGATADEAGRVERAKIVSIVGKSKGGREPPKTAFDVWLKRGLHQMFDDVAKEPIPEELLRLINADRPK